MYSVSEEYKEAIEGSSCEFKIEARVRLSDNTQLLFDDSTITDDVEIRSQMISGSASGKKIDIGAVAPSTLEITVTDDSADLHRFSGARIDLSVYLKLAGGEFEKVKMGTFFADNSKIKRYFKKITITAYDAMLSLQYAITADMRAELKNKTAQEAAQILTRYSRGTFSQDLTGFPNSDIFLNFDSRQIVTARDGIMWIAQLMGCFARFNRENHLEFVKIKSDWEMYDETTGTILAARNIRKRFKTTFSDDRMHIVGLSTRGADGKLVSVQSGGLSDDVNLTIELEQNPLITSSSKPTADILNAILSQVSTAYFYTFTSEIPNDPALDAGDTVRLQGGVINGTNQNNDLIGFITHNVWRYRGKHTITNAGQTPVLGAEAAQPAAASARRKAAARTASASDAETNSTAVAAEAQADGAEVLTYLPPKSQIEKYMDAQGVFVAAPDGSGVYHYNAYGIHDYTVKCSIYNGSGFSVEIYDENHDSVGEIYTRLKSSALPPAFGFKTKGGTKIELSLSSQFDSFSGDIEFRRGGGYNFGNYRKLKLNSDGSIRYEVGTNSEKHIYRVNMTKIS